MKIRITDKRFKINVKHKNLHPYTWHNVKPKQKMTWFTVVKNANKTADIKPNQTQKKLKKKQRQWTMTTQQLKVHKATIIIIKDKKMMKSELYTTNITAISYENYAKIPTCILTLT